MNTKTTNILAYIGWIGWLIAFLAGDKENAKFHLNQGLVLAIVETILACIPFVGWVAECFAIVCMILGIIAAAKDEEKPLPLIGKWQILK